MSKLSDLEICIKIAEIENWEWDCKAISYLGEMLTLDLEDEFNPLTDDGLCFRLMLKHGIEITSGDVNNAYAANESMYSYTERGIGFLIRSNNPNKAICLAIIEANK